MRVENKAGHVQGYVPSVPSDLSPLAGHQDGAGSVEMPRNLQYRGLLHFHDLG